MAAQLHGAAHPISSFFHVSPFLTIPCIIGSMHLSRGMAALSFAPEIDTLEKKIISLSLYLFCTMTNIKEFLCTYPERYTRSHKSRSSLIKGGTRNLFISDWAIIFMKEMETTPKREGSWPSPLNFARLGRIRGKKGRLQKSLTCMLTLVQVQVQLSTLCYHSVEKMHGKCSNNDNLYNNNKNNNIRKSSYGYACNR